MDHEANLDVLRAELKAIADRQDEMSATLHRVASAMEAIVRMEERLSTNSEALGRAFRDIGDHEKRLQIMERQIPNLREMRGWVIGGIAAVAMACIVAFANGNLLLTHPAVQAVTR